MMSAHVAFGLQNSLAKTRSHTKTAGNLELERKVHIPPFGITHRGLTKGNFVFVRGLNVSVSLKRQNSVRKGTQNCQASEACAVI